MRSLRQRCVLLLVGICLLVPGSLVAQRNVPWRLSYFPYLSASPNEGVMGIARAIWFQQAGWGQRVTLQKYLAIDAGYSTRDAWMARVTFGAPTLSNRFRIKARAALRHQPNFGDPDGGVTRDVAKVWVDGTYRVEGPLSLAVRAGVRRDQFSLPVFSAEYSQVDASLRGAVVLDLRDREYEVNRGVLAQAGMIVGSAGDGSYTAPYASVAGWVHPILPLRLTARLAWRGQTDSDALAPRHEFPAWEGDYVTLGGPHSLRGLPLGAIGADGVELAGIEARFDVINVGELGAITLIGFVDGGKPLNDLVTIAQESSGSGGRGSDWVWAGGGGIAVRVLRAATLNITAARARGDTRWYVGTGWGW